MFTTEKGLEVGARISRFLSERRRRQKGKQKQFERSLHFIGLKVPRKPNGHVILER